MSIWLLKGLTLNNPENVNGGFLNQFINLFNLVITYIRKNSFMNQTLKGYHLPFMILLILNFAL